MKTNQACHLGIDHLYRVLEIRTCQGQTVRGLDPKEKRRPSL